MACYDLPRSMLCGVEKATATCIPYVNVQVQGRWRPCKRGISVQKSRQHKYGNVSGGRLVAVCDCALVSLQCSAQQQHHHHHNV